MPSLTFRTKETLKVERETAINQSEKLDGPNELLLACPYV
jgi:hypothetical protein